MTSVIKGIDPLRHRGATVAVGSVEMGMESKSWLWLLGHHLYSRVNSWKTLLGQF